MRTFAREKLQRVFFIFSDNQSFDLAGRRIITPRGGQIIIRNRRKVVVK